MASATVPARGAPSLTVEAGFKPAGALARRAFRDARVRTIAFAHLFALYSYVQPVCYRHAYPMVSDRLAFAHSFADNVGLRLFYGEPRSVATIGGYTAWRVGPILWLAEFAGFVLGGLPAGGSAYLALATASVVPVFVGVGALISQLAPTRRIALELGVRSWRCAGCSE